MSLPQDNEGLRERIKHLSARYVVPEPSGDNVYELTEEQLDQIMPVIEAEQTRLKAEADNHPSTQRCYQMGYAAGKREVIAKLRESLPTLRDLPEYNSEQSNQMGYRDAIVAVIAALDTLERGA